MSTHKNYLVFLIYAATTHTSALLTSQKLSYALAKVYRESFKAYKFALKQKILINIQLGVTFANTVDFCGPNQLVIY